ncbi:hypothetical protein [Staphylococcus epidermidis]|uniref:hypothetical protein n=1 Tax=Staphylococcus epidermidis TaxID=1282 RepID=UPI000F7F66F6|nr:hypothetical protein [Staphylococcus epidermidis]MCG1272709.1 hypothetical protein [Staphylococcus epidermidis]RTE16048.1 hypothetical protein BKL62_04595 [Staphylococcus epidermidis]RTE16744.1 hypothetical protein BKL64_01205 [Staphylococcus epidermidis]RTE17034.1 hypothetical protein BKL63_03545 [Staphylococcus epidermidis]RTE19963.1 hypothetical protein BKL71_08380 [Staphylococcus epidermidis]
MTNIPYTEIIGILAGNQKDVKDKKPKYSTIKINKEAKVLFDELVHQHRTKQVDFIEELLVEWCRHQDKEIYEQYQNNELPGQNKS